MAKAKLYSSIGSNFRRLILSLRDIAKKQARSISHLEEPTWASPEGWEGNPAQDISTKMAEVFDRVEENDMAVQAMSDPDQPGFDLDVTISQIQVDQIASLERAFRRRHLTRCRAAAHAAGRLLFHSEPTGLFERGVMGSVEDMHRQGAAGTGGS